MHRVQTHAAYCCRSAYGTLAGRRSSAEDARIEAARGWGLGRAVPSQKIYEFFILKWCYMVHSGRVVFKIHVLKGKENTCQNIGASSTQDDPCRSNIGGRDPCNLCGVDAYADLWSVCL